MVFYPPSWVPELPIGKPEIPPYARRVYRLTREKIHRIRYPSRSSCTMRNMDVVRSLKVGLDLPVVLPGNRGLPTRSSKDLKLWQRLSLTS